jgi:hypothetical protein
MSVPDLFMTRAGLTYMAQKLSFSGGFRIEGLPSVILSVAIADSEDQAISFLQNRELLIWQKEQASTYLFLLH